MLKFGVWERKLSILYDGKKSEGMWWERDNTKINNLWGYRGSDRREGFKAKVVITHAEVKR